MTASKNAATFVLSRDAQIDYPHIGPSCLERVDSRRTLTGYVHKYAPTGVNGPIFAESFWDSFDEVISLEDYRAAE